MRRLRHYWPVLLILIMICACSGCETLEMLHPRNTWRLNRGPALDEGDAYFSISDTAASEE